MGKKKIQAPEVTVKTSFRTERGMRCYEIENSSGEKLYLEETPDSALVFRREEGKSLNLSMEFVQALVPLFEHFARYGNLPLPEAEAADSSAFKVDDRVTCAGEGGEVFRIAKTSVLDDEGTKGSAYLLKDEGGTDHGWEDFRKIRRL